MLFIFLIINFKGSSPPSIIGRTSNSLICPGFRELKKEGRLGFSSLTTFIVVLSISNPKGSSFLKKSVTLQPLILDAIPMLVRPAINFLKSGFLNFSNLGVILTIASNAAGFCFKIAAIFVSELMIIVIRNNYYNYPDVC